MIVVGDIPLKNPLLVAIGLAKIAILFLFSKREQVK